MAIAQGILGASRWRRGKDQPPSEPGSTDEQTARERSEAAINARLDEIDLQLSLYRAERALGTRHDQQL